MTGWIVMSVAFVVWLVFELIGVASPKKNDTFTELVRNLRDRLPGPVKYAVRVFILGLLVWAALHLSFDLV